MTMPRAGRPVWSAAVGFGVLLATFAVGFLLLGEFGGWYYDGRGGYTEGQYNVDTGEYDSVRRRTGSESWGSDGVLTNAAVAFPIGLAMAALAGTLVLLLRVLLVPRAPKGRPLAWTAGLAATAAALIGIEAVLYASSMEPGDDWWLGSAFWAGMINSTLLAALAFSLRRAKRLWPTPGS